MLIDMILLLILVACGLSGWRKGLLMSLMGLLVAALCCLGAAAARQTLTPAAVNYLEPRLTDLIQPGIESELTEAVRDAGLNVGGQTIGLPELTGFLKQFGLDVEEAVNQGTATALGSASRAAASAIAHALAEQAAGAAIFFAAFLMLYLILHSAALAVNLVDRLPVAHTCNRLGGALLGLAGGLLVMVVAAAVCRQHGLLPAEPGPLSQLLSHLAGRLLE